ncbi:MAG: ParB/RepB/Spo0J family partition protein [Acidobacteria bacterium]|nr:ParB/RepB/Spo0J family partition protein [Acidobacteriota bacterium]
MTAQSSEIQSVRLCPVDLLFPHPHNPRGEVDPATVQDLADSIREKGVLEPLIVVPHPERPEGYFVVAGHRRRAASILAGLDEAPVIVRDYTPVEQEEVMLAENIQREDLSPLQEAKAYERLIAGGSTQMDVARRLGVNGARIQSRMVILKLSLSVQRLFDGNELPITLAPLLTRIENIDRQERLANLVASRRLTVPKLKEMVDRIVEAEQTDAEVNKERRGSRKEKKNEAPKRQVVVYTRANAVADLERRNGSALSYADLLKALEGVCENCGMAGFPDICAACPLPQFISNLVRKGNDAPHESQKTVVDARACA